MPESATDLHPFTRNLLSRRRMLATGGAAAVSFFGLTFLVSGCSSDDSAETDTGGGDATTTTPSTASAGGSSTTAAMDDSLYEQLGGYEAITLVMTNFVKEQVAKDARINHFFANTDLDNLIVQLSDFTANATGGPEEYTGLDMETVHKGMGVSEADFNALVEDLAAAMTVYDVPADVQEQVVAALAPLQPVIVEV